MSKKAAPAPSQPTDSHACTLPACACKACGGPTWYFDRKHVCVRAACGARW